MKWLSNSSFQSGIEFNKPIDITSSSSEDETVQVPVFPKREIIPENVKIISSSLNISDTNKSRKHHKKKKKKHKIKIEEKYEKQVDNLYYEDRILDARFCTVDTLCSRVRPLYNLSEHSLGFISGKRFKKRVFRRYYSKNVDKEEQSKKKDSIIQRTKCEEKIEILPEWCVNIEEEQKNKTQDFNKNLEENPHDIQIWLNYINFQVFYFIFLNLI